MQKQFKYQSNTSNMKMYLKRNHPHTLLEVDINVSNVTYVDPVAVPVQSTHRECETNHSASTRLVRAKKYMEQDQIQQLAMIPDKEAKHLTYKLLQENFLQMQELRKPTVSSGPNKTYFLFHVDLNQVARMVLDTCYKALANSLTRRNFEKNENSRLIEKKERIEGIAESMREQGTDEQQIQELVDDWLTPPERSLLESVEAMIKKMNLAELQVDDTVFLLQLFTYYQSTNIRVKSK
ncbi:DNA-directed RNA polymerase III subunit RPC3 [Homalodisca vitripennis]|nr:DNA-directed RNA polymerase III subunit RPC3 [Homalodisca vitripennis]